MDEKLIIAEKSYEICLDRIDEGYLWDEIICHADNINKAKSKLLKEIKYESMKLKNNGDDICFLNILVRRVKFHDKVIFEGKEVFRHSIDEIIAERARIAKLDEIANNPHIEYCYIFKGSYYRPNSCGYTSLKFEAGVYTKYEAISHAKSCRDIRLERIDIEEHNKMINDKITELKSRILILTT